MYLGIDLGTSSVKSVLIDDERNVVGTASRPLFPQRPTWHASEQNPEDWHSAALETMDELANLHSRAFGALKGIGLAGQMHGLTLLDENGEALRPAMLWNDGRSVAECEELERSPAGFVRLTGNRVMPGFTAPKAEWVRRHEPRLFERARRVLLPKDYLRFRLTGEFATEMSDASGTMWLDVAQRRWNEGLLRATGLDRSHVPRLVEGNQTTGELSPALCRRWGLSRSPQVAGGGGDNAASACGLGAVNPGDAFLSLGTSGVLWITTDACRSDPDRGVHSFCHALPDRWHQMAVMLSAMDGLNWLGEIAGKSPEELCSSLPGLDAKVPFFLPYLSGERTPHLNPEAGGAFTELSRSHGLDDLALSVLKGIAFACRDVLETLRDSGNRFESLPLIGGGSRIEGFPELLASVLALPVLLVEEGDLGAAFGAARLAMDACGSGSDPYSKPAVACEVFPDETLRELYDEEFRRFRRLYPAVHFP